MEIVVNLQGYNIQQIVPILMHIMFAHLINLHNVFLNSLST